MTPREQWTHEDNLIAHRLNWLLCSQSFLFGAYAVSLNHLAGRLTQESDRLIRTLPWLALFSLALTLPALVASTIVQKKLEKNHIGEVRTTTWASWFGWLPPIGLPIVFAAAWIYLLWPN